MQVIIASKTQQLVPLWMEFKVMCALEVITAHKEALHQLLVQLVLTTVKLDKLL